MAEAKILKCKCASAYQDSVYGNGNRLFNPTGKGSGQGDGYRCTVCGAVVGSARVKTKK